MGAKSSVGLVTCPSPSRDILAETEQGEEEESDRSSRGKRTQHQQDRGWSELAEFKEQSSSLSVVSEEVGGRVMRCGKVLNKGQRCGIWEQGDYAY